MGIINTDFDTPDQLLIIYSVFVKYLIKNGNRVKQCISYLQTSTKAYDLVTGEVLYNILIEFGIHMKLVRLIKVRLNETYDIPCRQTFRSLNAIVAQLEKLHV